jgi:hypothetical protein
MVAFGTGFECYGPEIKRFGRPEVIKAIESTAAEWAKRYPAGPRLGIGNLSFEQGGLARALTGKNSNGAIEDFQAFVSWTTDVRNQLWRRRWIQKLQQGKNPFTEEEILRLIRQQELLSTLDSENQDT